MANIQITQLPTASTLTGTEAVPVVQNGVTVQTTTGAITSGPSLTQTFLTVGSVGTLANARYLALGGAMTAVDGGAGSSYTINVQSNPTIPGTAGMILPTGTTAQRGGTNGQIRYNTTTNLVEVQQAGTWSAFGSGTVTSIDVLGGSTGLTTSGGPITSSGTITLAGTLNVANGGTGQTSLAAVSVGSATTATTATNLAGGTLYQVPYQTAAGTTLFVAAPTIASTYLSYTGSGLAWAAAGGGGSSLTVGATIITLGTTGRILYDNAGILGELATTGSGNVVLATSPTLVTPVLGTPTSGNFSTGTFTWPTFNQNTSGQAGSVAQALTAGSNITFSSGTTYNGSAAITINATSAQVYPGAGIPNSTGTAWGTSYTTTGSGTVVALATSPSFTTPILGTPQSGNFSTGTFTWPTFNQNTTGTASNVTGTVAVANGGTGATTLTGVVYGNGTSAFTTATGAQIATAIGSTVVTNATNAANTTAAAGSGATNYIMYASSATGNVATNTTTGFTFNATNTAITGGINGGTF